VLLAACAPSAPPSPTAVPADAAKAKPAAAPATSPAKSAPAPAAPAAAPTAPAAAKAGEPTRGGKIVLAVKERPTTLDVHKHVLTVDRVIAPLLSDAMTFLDENLEVQPGLAESWEQQDDRTWLFRLRKGVTFHDGTPFNAQAVKFNFDRVAAPETKAPQAGILEAISSTEVVDDSTVRLRLKSQFAPLLRNVGYAIGYMVSPAAVQKFGDDYGANPVGTGPFVFKELVPGDHLTLVANKSYWRGAPNIDELEVRFIPDEANRSAQLQAGQVDIVDSIGVSDVRAVEANSSLDLVRVPVASWTFLAMNTQLKPLDDPRVRQAINQAIDVEAIVKNIYQGAAVVQKTAFPQNLYGYSPNVKPYDFNVAGAKALLAEAGLASGFETELWYPIGKYVAVKEVSEAIQGYLRAVGIQAKVVGVDDNALRQANRSAGESKVPLGIENWGAAVGDPDRALIPRFHTASIPPRGVNVMRYSNPKVDEFLDKAATVYDPAERLKLYEEAQKLMMADAPVVWINQVVELRAKKKSIQGVRNAADYRILFDKAWVAR
jgi:peptide/nickel transport system substrate-binding protein